MEVNLNDILVFTQVVQAGSFTGAARALGVPTSTVSRRVSRLEERLEARLLQRTTRSLRLTDAGRIYFEHGSQIVADLEEAERAVSEVQGRPRGKVRISAPRDADGYLWQLVGPFLAKFPDVEVELVSSDRLVDLVDEGFDIALRAGRRPDTGSFVGRKLAESSRVLVARPAYLERRGVPTRAEELSEHDCLIFPALAPQSTWTLHGQGGDVKVAVSGRFVMNSFEVIKMAAIDGMGIAQLITAQCCEDLKAGRLVEVLPNSCLCGDSIWVIYPSRRHMAAAVRAFVDHVVENFDEVAGASNWTGCGDPG